MKTWIFVGWVASVAVVASADTLKIGSTVHQGSFIGFEKSLLNFETEKMLSERLNRVSALTVDPPLEVQITYTNKKTDTGVLTGYSRMKFHVEVDGKPKTLYASLVRTVLPPPPPPAEEEPDRAAGQGRGRLVIDLDGMRRDELPENQRKALEHYEAAKANYDRYISESTAMGAAADAVTGPARRAVLAKLHARKYEEQPLREAFEQAEDGIRAAFPTAPAGGVPAAPQTREQMIERTKSLKGVEKLF